MSQQQTLFPEKEFGAARRTDPETSKAAAKSVDATDLESQVYGALWTPRTAHEIAEKLGLPLNTVSPRTAPLQRKGFIKDSGARREGPSGRKSIVWERVKQ
jgi:hypothetical protein